MEQYDHMATYRHSPLHRHSDGINIRDSVAPIAENEGLVVCGDTPAISEWPCQGFHIVKIASCVFIQLAGLPQFLVQSAAAREELI